jgi:hypothetical protein
VTPEEFEEFWSEILASKETSINETAFKANFHAYYYLDEKKNSNGVIKRVS